MSPRVLVFSIVGFAVVLGGLLWAIGNELSGGGEIVAGSSIDGRLEAKLSDLERRLESRLAALETRAGEGYGVVGEGERRSAERASGEDVETNDSGELDSAARFAQIEQRIADLELRFQASGQDPVQRGFTYLESESPQLRREGVRLLKRLARTDPEARRALRGMLADPDGKVREQAIEALAEARDREALPQILNLLADENAGVRGEALEAVEDLIGEDTDPAMIAAAIESVLPALSEPNRKLREDAIEVLGRLRAREAVPDLLDFLASEENDIRENAISALGEIGDPRALPALRDLYEKSGGGRDALRIARSLQRLGDPSAMVAEAARFRDVALTSTDARSRAQAIEFLAENAGEMHRDVLERALQDPDGRVRREAQQGLERIARGQGGREGQR